MDLKYLLLLQQFRESAGDLMTASMMLITNFATIGSAVLCVIIFWTVDRILGYWVIINTVSGLFINNVIKLTACVYRPWIRWQELDPPEKAIETATGYSFPSGHTQIASSFFGSCAMSARKNHKAVSAFCIAVILLTAFSRNFLGVHTLTDVVTSLLISAVMIAVNARLFDKAREDRSLLIKLLAAGCVAAVLAIARQDPPRDMRPAVCPDPDVCSQKADLFYSRHCRGTCYHLHCFDSLHHCRLSRCVYCCPQASKQWTGRRKGLLTQGF